ncbi:MAG: M15 family metallopeptidase [Burkholderiales bacterium]|nr:M15 family metallopeptidase [Burkholderiales bacterium]
MINSRKIEDLNPKLQELCRQFIEECRLAGIEIAITSTYRDNEYQDYLYAKGRTDKTSKIVTNARGGDSIHNYRLAFDFVPLQDGKPEWSDIDLFKQCGAVAMLIGLEWGGEWVHFKDYPHCQYLNGITLTELKSGKILSAID